MSSRDSSGVIDFFNDHFGLEESALTAALDTTLARRVDYADLFFEHTSQDAVVLEEGIVKNGDRHIEQGVGVRAVVSERQGYAHTDEITLESLQGAAQTARAISQDSGGVRALSATSS